MNKFLATLLTVGGLSVPAMAMSASTAEVDANGDGLLTIDEVQAVFPDITSDAFSAMDVNADGALDGDEVVAAQDAGLMPQTEG